MITQEIFDYMAQSAEGQSEYATVTGLILKENVLVQILSDGMTLFHNVKERALTRALMFHKDSIHDVVIKNTGDERLNLITCSRDNTIRLW